MLLSVIGFALVIIPRVANLGEFVVFDELLYWPWGNQFFQALLARDWAATLLGRGHPAITVLLIQCLGLGVRYGWALLSGESAAQALAQLHLDQEIIVFSDLAARRLPMALLNTLVVLALILLIYRQFGRRVALVSTILLALDPFLLSDSRTAACGCPDEWLDDNFGHQPDYLSDRSKVALFAAFGGLSRRGCGQQNFRFGDNAFYLPQHRHICLVAGSTGRLGAGHPTRLSELLVWSSLVVLVFWSFWPALWVAPGAALNLVLGFATNTSIEGRTNYFMGRVYTNEALPLFYIVIILLRISPLALIGLMAGLIKLFSRKQLAALKSQLLNLPYPLAKVNLQARMIVTVGLLLLYTATIWLVVTIGVLKRDHYGMPMFPTLDILGAMGLVGLIISLTSSLSNRLPRQQPGDLFGLGVGLILIIQAALSLPHHPYYYSYYNPLVLGPLWAHRVTMINWGPDLGEAARYLNSLDGAESLKATSATVARFIPEFKGTAIRFVYGEPWI